MIYKRQFCTTKLAKVQIELAVLFSEIHSGTYQYSPYMAVPPRASDTTLLFVAVDLRHFIHPFPPGSVQLPVLFLYPLLPY